MSPKFKGQTEEWMDDEGADKSARKVHKKKKKAHELRNSEALPLEESNATVTEVYSKLCQVQFDTDSTRALCSYRRSHVFGAVAEEGTKERTPVAVGDRVKALRSSPDAGVVEGVCLRRNRIVRKAPDRSDVSLHVIAANIDILVIVTAAKNPDFTPGLVDRFLIAAQSQNIQPILVVTKTDLIESTSERIWLKYKEYDCEVFELSNKTKEGLDTLRKRIERQCVVFCGHSGVGKTSLLNSLTQLSTGRVGATNETTGKGRHTTTSSLMIDATGGSRWIDTPGVREFALHSIDSKTLTHHFPEFARLSCTERHCLHQDEPDCEILAQPKENFPRLESYRKILDALLQGEF